MKTFYDNLNRRIAAAREQFNQQRPGENLPLAVSPRAAKPSLAPGKTTEAEAKQAA